MILGNGMRSEDGRYSFRLGRTIAGLTTGVVTIWVVGSLMAVLAVVTWPPPRLAIALDVSGVLVAFFLGGAAARRIAGHLDRTGWLGVVTALGFFVSVAVAPKRSWYYAVSPEAMAPPGFHRHVVIVSDYTLLMSLALGLVGTALACFGDVWVGARRRKREASGGQGDSERAQLDSGELRGHTTY